MPSFRIEDLMKSVYGSTLDVRHLDEKSKQEAGQMAGRKGKRPIEESKTLILNFITAAEKPVTLLEICDHLGRKPAPHYRAILNELVASKIVKKEHDFEAGPSIPRFLYSLNR